MGGDVIATFVIKDAKNLIITGKHVEDYVDSRVVDVKKNRAGVYGKSIEKRIERDCQEMLLRQSLVIKWNFKWRHATFFSYKTIHLAAKYPSIIL